MLLNRVGYISSTHRHVSWSLDLIDFIESRFWHHQQSWGRMHWNVFQLKCIWWKTNTNTISPIKMHWNVFKQRLQFTTQLKCTEMYSNALKCIQMTNNEQGLQFPLYEYKLNRFCIKLLTFGVRIRDPCRTWLYRGVTCSSVVPAIPRIKRHITVNVFWIKGVKLH